MVEDEVRRIVEKAQVGLVYAPNFSLGVNLFVKIVEHAAHLLGQCSDYDVAAMESHHRGKVDSPSSTARAIANTLLKALPGKDTVVYDRAHGEMHPNKLHFVSQRCGHIPGTHTITFDSSADTITLTHAARTREGFAIGAVMAAEWICHKKGFHTIDDFIQELTGLA